MSISSGSQSPAAPRGGNSGRLLLSLALLAGGLALIAWSFLGAASAKHSGWSPEQASEYQAASARLHGLSHSYAEQLRGGDPGAAKAELDQAKEEYNALRERLDAAIARPKRIAWLLRVGGAALALAGGCLLYWLPPASSD